MKRINFFLILLLFYISKYVFCKDWEYENSDFWKKNYEECNGKRQSPINIQRQNCKYLKDNRVTGYNFVVDGNDKPHMYMKNDGHTITIFTSENIKLKGSGLKGSYSIYNVHFHWGERNDVGSEHQIDGVAYPMEMHIVTYDTERFDNINQALESSDGLAVFGILFHLGIEENKALTPLLNQFQNTSLPDKSKRVIIQPLDLNKLLPSLTNSYFRYEGSLTTPACNEAVIWTIFESSVEITLDQIELFRNLKMPQSNVNNFRQVQSLNKRLVYWSLIPQPKKIYVAVKEFTGKAICSSFGNGFVIVNMLMVSYVTIYFLFNN